MNDISPKLNEIRFGRDCGYTNCASKKYQYLVCPICGKPRWVRLNKGLSPKKDYLCIKCVNQIQKNNRIVIERFCLYCGKPFQTAPYKSKKYCSRSCAISYRNTLLKGKPKKIFIDLIGKRFGKLTVLSRFPSKDKWGRILWLCQCDCGNTQKAITSNLKSGRVRSCGCQVGSAKRLPEGVSSMKRVIEAYRKHAISLGLPYEITDGEFRTVTQSPCFYCSSKPSNKSHPENSNGEFIYNGIDRVDNSRGYTTDNIVPCCKICNMAKQTLTQQEFYTWVKRVFKHYKKPASIGMILEPKAD